MAKGYLGKFKLKPLQPAVTPICTHDLWDDLSTLQFALWSVCIFVALQLIFAEHLHRSLVADTLKSNS